MPEEQEFTATVLRNRGAPVKLYAIAEDGTPLRDGNGEPSFEVRWLRFDANAVAELESWYLGYTDVPVIVDGTPAVDANGNTVTEKVPVRMDKAFDEALRTQ